MDSEGAFRDRRTPETPRRPAGRGLRIVPVRSWGTTEVLPPEDADVVVDVENSRGADVADGEAVPSWRNTAQVHGTMGRI